MLDGCSDHSIDTAEFSAEAANNAHATRLPSFQCGNSISKLFVVAARGRKLIKVAAAALLNAPVIAVGRFFWGSAARRPILQCGDSAKC